MVNSLGDKYNDFIAITSVGWCCDFDFGSKFG